METQMTIYVNRGDLGGGGGGGRDLPLIIASTAL